MKQWMRSSNDFKGDDAFACYVAIEALNEVGPPEAVDSLIEKPNDEH